VVDDGSTDGSGDIAKRYAADDPRVVVHSYPENRRWAAVNETIEALGEELGDYVARMDCDDVCLPERLETQVTEPTPFSRRPLCCVVAHAASPRPGPAIVTQVDYLDAHPEIDGLGGSVETFVEAADKTGAKPRTVAHPTSPSHVLWSLFFGCAIAHPTSMVRRGLMRRMEGYRVGFWVAEDYDFWLRSVPEARLANLDLILVRYRQHAGNISRLVEKGEGFRYGCTAVRDAAVRFLGREVSMGEVEGLRRPSTIQDVTGAKAAISLLKELEGFVLQQDWLAEEDRAWVKGDAGKRVGELVMVAMQLDPVMAQPLMLEWMQQDGGAGSKAQLGMLMAMGR